MRLAIIVLWLIGMVSLSLVQVLDTEGSEIVAYMITVGAWSLPAGTAAGLAFAGEV